MNEQVVEFHWVVPEGARRQALQALEADGATVENSGEHFRADENEFAESSESNFEPLIVIVSLLGVARLLRQVEMLWRDFRSEGGWVVDLRGGKVQLQPLPNTPRDQLVIVTDEGASTHRCNSARSFREKLEAALTEPAE